MPKFSREGWKQFQPAFLIFLALFVSASSLFWMSYHWRERIVEHDGGLTLQINDARGNERAAAKISRTNYRFEILDRDGNERVLFQDSDLAVRFHVGGIIKLNWDR